jgi:hypothetical protein
LALTWRWLISERSALGKSSICAPTNRVIDTVDNVTDPGNHLHRHVLNSHSMRYDAKRAE